MFHRYSEVIIHNIPRYILHYLFNTDFLSLYSLNIASCSTSDEFTQKIQAIDLSVWTLTFIKINNDHKMNNFTIYRLLTLNHKGNTRCNSLNSCCTGNLLVFLHCQWTFYEYLYKYMLFNHTKRKLDVNWKSIRYS